MLSIQWSLINWYAYHIEFEQEEITKLVEVFLWFCINSVDLILVSYTDKSLTCINIFLNIVQYKGYMCLLFN